MRYLQISLLLLVVGFATGCPKPKYGPSISFKNPTKLVAELNEHIKTEQEKYYCYRIGLVYPCPAGTTATVTDGPAKAKIIRNDLIENALPYLDGAYVDFITDIQAGRDRNNFLLDLVELGTAASVGITKGERPLQIIGVALTAFRGGRRSLDANFYKDTSTPILISKMDGNRARVRASILTREKQEVSEYPLGAAVADLVDYYNAGTLVRAFSELAKDTSIKTAEAENLVRHIKGDVEITEISTIDQENVANAILKQRERLEDEKDAAQAEADKITVPNAVVPATTANTNDRNAALAQQTAKLKPIRDKLEKTWNEVKGQTAFASAIAKMKTQDPSQAILAKLDATPPQRVSEEDYLTLIRVLSAELANNAEASKQFLAILRRTNP